MRILYIITSGDPGGAQKYVLDLAVHFGGEIAAGDEHSGLRTEATNLRVPYHPVRFLKRAIHPLFDPLALLELYRLIKKVRPDVVHLNSSKAGFLGSLAGWLARTPTVFTAHGFVYNEPMPAWKRRMYKTMEKLSHGFHAMTITLSETEQNQALAEGIISAGRSTIIRHGILPPQFLSREHSRTLLGAAPGVFVFGCVANFYPAKNHATLLEAVRELAALPDNNFQVSLIGGGPLANKISATVKKNNLTPVVVSHGYVSDASRLMCGFDALVLPSSKEGFPYVLLEALHAGIPIVATNVGGNHELLGDAGILVPPNDPKALSRALALVRKDGELRYALAQKAKKRVALFTRDAFLAETQRVYERVFTRPFGT